MDKKPILTKILTTNKRASFDYEILEKYTAGLCLSSGMVKQIRSNRINIQGKFIVSQNGRLEILGMGNEKISENIPLLLNQRELKKIIGQLTEKGTTCIALNIKAVGRWLKCDIALAKGKKNYDKREDIKKKDMDRQERRGILY
jgi:SsrA-binding protein